MAGKRAMRNKTRQDKPMAKGGRVKKQLGGAMPGVGAAGAARPLPGGVQRPLAAGAARPLGGGVLPGARMVKKGGKVSKAKGGRVKAMAGGMKAKKKK